MIDFESSIRREVRAIYQSSSLMAHNWVYMGHESSWGWRAYWGRLDQKAPRQVRSCPYLLTGVVPGVNCSQNHIEALFQRGLLHSNSKHKCGHTFLQYRSPRCKSQVYKWEINYLPSRHTFLSCSRLLYKF